MCDILLNALVCVEAQTSFANQLMTGLLVAIDGKSGEGQHNSQELRMADAVVSTETIGECQRNELDVGYNL